MYVEKNIPTYFPTQNSFYNYRHEAFSISVNENLQGN